MMILDVDDDETGGSVPNNSIYDQSSRRQFRDETKGKKKKKNPYV